MKQEGKEAKERKRKGGRGTSSEEEKELLTRLAISIDHVNELVKPQTAA